MAETHALLEGVCEGKPKDTDVSVMSAGKEMFEPTAVFGGCTLELSIAA